MKKFRKEAVGYIMWAVQSTHIEISARRLACRNCLARLVLCLPFFLLPLAAQETPAPPADDVVRRALTDQQRVIDLLDKYTYTKHVISESTDGKGKVTGHQERVLNYVPCEDMTCITLVSVNGAPPKSRELKEHQKAVEKEWEKKAKKSAEDRQKEEDDDL